MLDSPSRARLASQHTAAVVILLCANLIAGCTRHNVTPPAPIAPQHLGTYRIADAPDPIIIAIDDFRAGKFETNVDEDQEKNLKQTAPLAVSNGLQELIGKRQLFKEVLRVGSSGTTGSSQPDYLVSGTYDLYLKLGTSGREWIPFAGTFGAKINEATANENTDVIVKRSRDGETILHRAFPSNQQETTSIYSQPRVGFLQPNYLAEISSAIVAAIQADSGNAPRNASAEEKLSTLEDLRRKGLITEKEYVEQRKVIIQGVAH